MTKTDQLVCLDILKRGLRNSSYYYHSGQLGNVYLNIDTAILGDDLETELRPQYDIIEDIAQQFVLKISEIEAENEFDRLAFIDKGGHGPVGAIALSTLLVIRAKKEAIFVRPYRNTIRSIAKGRSIREGESLLIISDVATTGQTILQTASKLWDKGALVIGALVFFDHELGATENLISHDLKLYSVFTRSQAIETSNGDIPLEDIQPEFMREFGALL